MPEDSPDVKLTTNRSGWVWAGLVAAAGALAALDCFARGYASLGMTALAWTALIVWLVLLFLVFPGLWLTPSGLRVRNPLTVIEIPFGALRDVRTRMFLELLPNQGEPVAVWAAPQSSMSRRRAAVQSKLEERMAPDRDEARAKASSQLVQGILAERDRALTSEEKGNAAAFSTEVLRSRPRRDWLVAGGLTVLAIISLLLV